jgi:RHH-type transcriptional regulator, rel operon repressor / antitoxin RelB
MPRTEPVMTRITPELKEKLRSLARHTERSEAYLVARAVEEYVELNEWQVAEIKRRLDEARAGAPGVAHEDVEAWLDSWGTEDERPPPEVERR